MAVLVGTDCRERLGGLLRILRLAGAATVPADWALDESTPNHSTISRTRRLIDVGTHRRVIGWVLGLLADRGLLKGKMVGVDATTLEANVAMRSIIRRDNDKDTKAFLTELAKKSGIATPI